MDKIQLNQMTFYGFHGVFPEEKKLGQRFLVDLTLELDLRQAGETDDLQHSIDYGLVYQLTKNIVEGPSKKLVETVAENLASELLAYFDSLQACRVKVIKPDPPIPGYYQSVAVEIYREKQV
ncbi:dihydroneopterin aldolase [Gracilibacillus alcaliphilus]|uniref:dihydroneopterin aldolase n=1 Tax=Gracilibacillus alcaliphilus TaxID=1401441 RepID=UPI00195A34B5|nr:dihydroneopterin aldolase [Gracilibacillus alcaliphilus]MBM7678156.1 dihydroneopterin aldolase [Gracilibacillus alcaliphilus]